ncbi:hypothetical protein AgCh_028835 [Apium graveolens]
MRAEANRKIVGDRSCRPCCRGRSKNCRGDGGVDRSIECTGHIDAIISAFECVHDFANIALGIADANWEAGLN